jgi:hypothetical protein
MPSVLQHPNSKKKLSAKKAGKNYISQKSREKFIQVPLDTGRGWGGKGSSLVLVYYCALLAVCATYVHYLGSICSNTCLIRCPLC